MSARATLLAITALLPACNLDFDVVGPFGGGAQGGAPASAGSPANGGSSEGGSPPVCNGSCTDLGTFIGPFSLDEAGCQEPMLGGYADSQPPFIAAPASCGCACEPPAVLGCGPVAVTFYDELGCQSVSGTLDLQEGACLNPEGSGVSAYSFDRPLSGGVASSMCVSNRAPPTKPPIAFLAPFTACALDESSCGGSDVCLPQDLSGLCVMSAQDQPCPSPFPVRRTVLLESELDDGRDCECVCGALSAVCTPAFELYQDGSCATADTALLTPDCIAATDNTVIEGIIYRPLASNAVCSTLPGPFGEVTAGPVNVLCCAND